MLRANQTRALVIASGAAAAIVALILVAASNRRRALRRDVIAPVQSLIDGLESAAAGNFDQRLETHGSIEIMRVVTLYTVLFASCELSTRPPLP